MPLLGSCFPTKKRVILVGTWEYASSLSQWAWDSPEFRTLTGYRRVGRYLECLDIQNKVFFKLRVSILLTTNVPFLFFFLFQCPCIVKRNKWTTASILRAADDISSRSSWRHTQAGSSLTLTLIFKFWGCNSAVNLSMNQVCYPLKFRRFFFFAFSIGQWPLLCLKVIGC